MVLFFVRCAVAVIGHVDYSENAEDALTHNVEHLVRSKTAEIFGVNLLKCSE